MTTGVTTVEQLSLILDLSRSFNALIELDELLPVIIEKTQEVLDAESSAILLLDEDKHELFFPVTSDIRSERAVRLRDIRFPSDKGLAGWVLQHGTPTLVADVTQDTRFYSAVDTQTGAQTQGLLCAPLRTRHGIIGVIELRNKRAGRFTEEDLTVLEALSGPVAIAIENAQLYHQVRQSEALLKEEVATLQKEMAHRQQFAEIIGNGPAMSRIFALMESAIPTPITVLLQGETGTGKELIARAIHYNGPRKDRPFVTVNCGALQDTLLESELFGHKKGSFTGATADKAGLFEVAHGGTIFLDEIGETSPAFQVKLLRVLQEGEIQRVGETHQRKVDVRVISATNRDLEEEIKKEAKEERFREDLYYRLNVFPIVVPPLRERREDISLLVSHFLTRSNEKMGKRLKNAPQDTLRYLTHYSWPGNVRELENELERAVALTPQGTGISPEYLSEKITAQGSLRVSLPVETQSLKEAKEAFEKEYVAEILRQHQSNAAQTAKVLGLSRQMLQRKIKGYDLRSK